MVEYTAKGVSAARQSCEQGSTMGQDGYPTTVTPSLGSDPLRPYFVHRLRDVCSVCEKVLALPEDVLNARRTATRELVKERHLISHRVDTIISTAEALLKHRNGELTLEAALRHLRLWHFLPEVDLESEYKYAVLNWVG